MAIEQVDRTTVTQGSGVGATPVSLVSWTILELVLMWATRIFRREPA